MRKFIFLLLLLLYPVLISHATSEQWGWVAITYEPARGGGTCYYCNPAFEDGDCTGFHWYENRIVGANYVQNSRWDNFDSWQFNNWGKQAFCKVQFEFTVESEDELEELVDCLAGTFNYEIEDVWTWFNILESQAGSLLVKGAIPTAASLVAAARIVYCYTNFDVCIANQCKKGEWDYYHCHHCAKRFYDVDCNPWAIYLVDF